MTSSAPTVQPGVQHRAVPARTLLCAVQRLRPAHLDNFVNGASQALPVILAQQGAEQLGSVQIIYHQPVTEESSGPVEVCVPYQGELEVPEGLVQRSETAHREAYLMLTKRQFGDSGAFHQARREVESYARANGEVTGPLRRVDYGVWSTRGTEDVVGELTLPLRWLNQLRPETRGRLFP